MKIGLFINPCQNLFQNGCFQQSYFIFKALKTANSNIRLFSTGNSSFDNSDASFNLIGTPVTLINDINDVVDLDLMLFVSGVLYQEDFLLQMKTHGTRLVHVICGNWLCLFQEEWTHNVHQRASKAFHPEIEEYWVLPMYRDMIPFLTTLTHRPVYLAPYVWDEEIIDTRCRLGGLQINYPNDNQSRISDKNNQATKEDLLWHILIMEPNMSIHKTGLLPLLICERLYVELGYTNIKVLLFCQRETEGFKHIISMTRLFKDGRIEFYHRMETPLVLHQLRHKNHNNGHIAIVSHQHNNILNFLHLEMYHYGYPIIHNCPPYQSMGYYYKDDDVISGTDQLWYAIHHHKDTLGLYQEKAKKLLYQYHFSNPEVYQTWKRMCVETICRKTRK